MLVKRKEAIFEFGLRFEKDYQAENQNLWS